MFDFQLVTFLFTFGKFVFGTKGVRFRNIIIGVKIL